MMMYDDDDDTTRRWWKDFFLPTNTEKIDRCKEEIPKHETVQILNVTV